jgi:hypothetical protein
VLSHQCVRRAAISGERGVAWLRAQGCEFRLYARLRAFECFVAWLTAQLEFRRAIEGYPLRCDAGRCGENFPQKRGVFDLYLAPERSEHARARQDSASALAESRSNKLTRPIRREKEKEERSCWAIVANALPLRVTTSDSSSLRIQVIYICKHHREISDSAVRYQRVGSEKAATQQWIYGNNHERLQYRHSQ